MQISLNDLPPGLSVIGEEEAHAVAEAVRSKHLSPKWSASEPSYTELFENQFSTYIGVKQCLAVNSGTSALITSLVGLGIQRGDEVIVPSYTWISTALAVIAVGATPIVAKIDHSLNMSAADLMNKITQKTRAVIVVHMRGSPANMEQIMRVCRKANIFVVEDVAQSVGGRYGKEALGSIGDIGAFSFQSNKILTCGEGGAVTTNNEDYLKRCMIYHDTDNNRTKDKLTLRGVDANDVVLLPGVNFRLAEILACVLYIQLQKLSGIIYRMRQVKQLIKEDLHDLFQRQGISWKHEWDDNGDTGLALVFFQDESDKASRITAYLRNNGVSSYTLDSIRRKDLHNAANWNNALSNNYEKKRRILIDEDVVDETTGLLTRSVHVQLNPLLTVDDGRLIAALIRKAIQAKG